MAKPLSISTIIEEVMSAISRAAYHPHRVDVYKFISDPDDSTVESGQQYIVTGTGTSGVFIGNENKFATRSPIPAAWGYSDPTVDVLVYLIDEERLVTWTGSEWIQVALGVLSDVPPPGGTAFDAPASAGIENNATRHDHVHAMADPTAGITTQVTSATTTSDEGTASAPARSDHTHGMTVNMTEVAGSITDVQHSTLAGGNLHGLAVPNGANGFISGADQASLDNLIANPPGPPAFTAVSTAAIANQPIESGTILEIMEDFTSYGVPTWNRTSATELTCTKPGLYSLSGEILMAAGFASILTQMWIKLSGNIIKTTWFSLDEGANSLEYGLWFPATAGQILTFEIGQGPDLANGAIIHAVDGPGTANPTHGTQLRMNFIE